MIKMYVNIVLKENKLLYGWIGDKCTKEDLYKEYSFAGSPIKNLLRENDWTIISIEIDNIKEGVKVLKSFETHPNCPNPLDSIKEYPEWLYCVFYDNGWNIAIYKISSTKKYKSEIYYNCYDGKNSFRFYEKDIDKENLFDSWEEALKYVQKEINKNER